MLSVCSKFKPPLRAVLCVLLLVPSLCLGSGELNQGFTYEGRLYNADGSAPLLDTVNFKFQIYNPAGTCLLYEETQSGVNLSTTSGAFALAVGSPAGDVKRTPGVDPGLSMAQIFQNSAAVSVPVAVCPAGSYSPVAGASRKLKVTVIPQSTMVAEVLSPDYVVSAVPQALVCESLQGVTPSGLIQAQGSVTQGNVAALVGGTDISALNLHTHDSRYVQKGASVDLGSGTAFVSGSVAIGTNNAGGNDIEIQKTAPSMRLDASGNTGAVAKIDFYGNGSQKASIQSLDNSSTLKFFTGSTLAVQLNPDQSAQFNGNVGVSGALTLAAQKTLTLGTFNDAQEAGLVASLTPAVNYAGVTWVNNQTPGASVLKYWDGTVARSVATAGSGVAQFNGRTGNVTSQANDYTWAQIDKSSSSLADLATRSASDLSSGVLGDARLSANVAMRNAANIFGVGGQTINSATASAQGLILKTTDDSTTKNIFEVRKSDNSVLYSLYSDGTMTANSDLTTKGYVTTAIASGLGGYFKADGSVPMAGVLDMNSHKIGNVTDPASAQDAATKNYADTKLGTRTLATVAPAAGQVLTWNNGSSIWEPTTLAAGGVTTFKGRAGAVVPATNDYTWAQIDKTGSSLADLATRSATDLTSGTLGDARLSANVALKTYVDATLATRALSSLAPAGAQYMGWNAGSNVWEPTTLSASNLAAGTIPDARLSSNIAQLNGGQTFTAGTTFSVAGTSAALLATTSNASGNGLTISAPSGANHLKFQATGVDKWVQYVSGSDFRFLESGATDRLTLQAGGNVGIGTTNPSATFHISTAVPTVTITNTTGQDVDYGRASNLLFTGSTAGGTPGSVAQIKASQDAASAGTTQQAGRLSFYAANYGGGLLEVMKVQSNGIFSANSLPFVITTGSSGTGLYNGYLNVRGDGSTASGSYIDFQSNRLSINNTSNGGVQLKTGAGVVLVADSVGNVGIGTTSPGYPLHVSAALGTTPFRVSDPTQAWGIETKLGGANGATINFIGNSSASYIALAGANLIQLESTSRLSLLTDVKSNGAGNLGYFSSYETSGTWNNVISNTFRAPTVNIDQDIAAKPLAVKGGNAGAISTGTNRNGGPLYLYGGTPMGGQAYGNVVLAHDGTTSIGNVGIGLTGPTAILHLKAGAAAANGAPLKLTQGVNLTTTETGAIEFDGTNLYYTDNTAPLASARRQIATTAGVSGSYLPLAGGTETNTITSSVAAGTNGLSVTSGDVNVGGAYKISGNAYLSTNSAGALQIGNGAGNITMTGGNNTLIGTAAGSAITSGVNNTLLGRTSGFVLAGGGRNTFLGSNTGSATTSGNSNTAVGMSAGQTNSTGSNNTLIGDSADVASGNLTNATAIGANASVSTSNSLVLGGTGGNAVNVGVGTTAPGNRLSVNGLSTADALPQVAVSTGAAANKGMVIQGVAAQTASLQEWQNSAGQPMTYVTSGGNLYVGFGAVQLGNSITNKILFPLQVQTNFGGNTSLFVDGTGGQTADIFQVRTSGGTVLANVTAGGNVGIGTASPKTTLDVNGTMRLAKNAAQPFACDAAHDGAIALTSSTYRLCVCNGGTTTWVFTSDGVTGCIW